MSNVASFFLYVFIVLLIVVSLFLILLVLIQKGRGGGLSGAFGGVGGHSAFGTKTGDVLTWATSIIFGVFLLLAIVLNLLANNQPVKKPGGAGTGSPPASSTPEAPGAGRVPSSQSSH